MHDELAKLKAQENQILRSYLEKKIVSQMIMVMIMIMGLCNSISLIKG